MKELTAVRYEGYMKKGGSTKPWKVITIDLSAEQIEEAPYVLKLFSENTVQQQHAIGKELFCSKLANHFDLVTPDPAIIKLDDLFISTLTPELQLHLSQKHQGYNFACRLCESATLLDEKLTRNLVSIQDTAKVFAFDCLTQNLDRGGFRNKPNLLVDDEGLILIDHEQTFPFVDDESGNAFIKKRTDILNKHISYQFQKHQFYPVLKAYKGSKKGLLDEFEELLRRINMTDIESLIRNIEQHNISIGLSEALIEYLWTLKRNSDSFCKTLLGLIS